MASIKNGVGSNIKLWRKTKGITQEELAEIIGIHSRQLSKIETGDHFPSCKTMERICMALDIEPKTLFDFKFWTDEYYTEMTGTDNIPVFRIEKKSCGNENVYNILPENKNTPKQKTCTDKTMAKYAKTLNRPVFAEYYDNNKNSKTVVFYPDGREKVVKNDQNAEAQQELLLLIKEIKNISSDSAAMDFLKTALKSLNSNKELKKLSTIIDGMKLARKIK